MIEHLSRHQGLAFLHEAARILKPGGIIRLATPDLEALVEEYRVSQASGGDRPRADHLMTRMHFLHDNGEGPVRRIISRNLSGHWHQWLYDKHSLCALLTEAGFHDPRVVTFRQGSLPDLSSIEFREEGLFVEAAAACA
jgi:predicted SAM-dependent methyltransferase